MQKAFIASVYARNDGKVLLVRHRRIDLWVPVGGGLEPNESPAEAAMAHRHLHRPIHADHRHAPGAPRV